MSIARGAAVALLSALAFGLTMPFVERAGRGVGPFATASLLYFGASGSALLLSRVSPGEGERLRRAHLRLLGLIAVCGAGVAPTAMAWGLQRAGATTGSLMLNLEAVFTVLLAWVLYREPIGGRVAVALTMMAAGGVVLTLSAAQVATFSVLGALAITLATAAWALDNALTRGLAHVNPVSVVAGKGFLGGVLTLVGAVIAGDAMPGVGAGVMLAGCGATGYGLSLRLYLLAQRQIGAARTGSIFAVAPFVGAAAGWLLGDTSGGASTLAAAGLFAVGVVLHVTEPGSVNLERGGGAEGAKWGGR